MASIQSIARGLGFSGKGTCYWGEFEGYRFGLVLEQQQNSALRIFTAARLPDSANRDAVAAVLNDMVTQKSIGSYSVTAYGYELVLRPGAFSGLSTEKTRQAISGLAAELRRQGAAPACHNCGTPAGLSFAQLNGAPLSLCGGCMAGIEEALRAQEDAHAQLPGNYVRGAAGALIGALIGGALWVLIGVFGYIAALAGLAIFALAVKGYGLVKGKLDRIAVVIICLTCLIVFVLAQFITMDVIVVKELVAEGYQPDYGAILAETFSIPFYNSELTRSFIGDAALGFVFMVLGSWWTVRDISRKAAKPAGNLVRLPG